MRDEPNVELKCQSIR